MTGRLVSKPSHTDRFNWSSASCPPSLIRKVAALFYLIVSTGTALVPAPAIEDPENFKTSRAVGAWLGLTTRRYQSGEIDYDGHISRRGDAQIR
jgi:hypothetical protein